MRGMSPEVTARVVTILQALIGVRNGDSRRGATREMGDMVAPVVVNFSDLGEAAVRRGSTGAVARAVWGYWREEAEMLCVSSHWEWTLTGASI